MISSVLVVCVGNICRSPVGERMLRAHRPGLRVESAGLGAVVGAGVDADMAAVAQARGLDVDGHAARQFGREMGAEYDLILVMEPGHRAEILRNAPELSGKTMTFDHWTGGRGIPDPYRREASFHARVYDLIEEAAGEWAKRLK